MQFLKEKLLPLTENIIMQDKIDVFNDLMANDLAWEYIEEKLEQFFEKKGG
jgi:hypothetical protein